MSLRGVRWFCTILLIALFYLLVTACAMKAADGGAVHIPGLSISINSMHAPLSFFWYLLLASGIAITAFDFSRIRRHVKEFREKVPPLMEERSVPVILSVLFAGAMVLRLYQCDLPPLEFHPTRQYNDALIARHIYHTIHPPREEWKKNFHDIEGFFLEPPLIELASTGVFLIAGRESFCVPLILNSLFWIGGGMLLYGAVRKSVNHGGALFFLLIFLFLPFSIRSSRAFMPDPLMVAALCAYIYSLMNFMENPGRKAFLVAACAGAVAVLAKAYAFFPVMTGIAGVLLCSREARSKLAFYDGILFFFIVALPSWLYGSLFLGHALKGRLWGRFIPSLLSAPSHYMKWCAMLDESVGFSLLLVALCALVLMRASLRTLVISLMAGYLLFCFVFNYHCVTHNYYHMMLIPIIAILMAHWGDFFAYCLKECYGEVKGRRFFWFAVCVLCVAFSIDGASKLKAHKVHQELDLYQKIGRAVCHSRSTFILAPDYGHPLRYHGWVEGLSWPDSADMRYWAVEGVPVNDEVSYFRKMREMKKPDYFIILSPDELQCQPRLAEELKRNYPVIWSEGEARIHDLRAPAP